MVAANWSTAEQRVLRFARIPMAPSALWVTKSNRDDKLKFRDELKAKGPRQWDRKFEDGRRENPVYCEDLFCAVLLF